MASSLSFLAGDGAGGAGSLVLNNLSGSGLGFYGTGYATSVAVGQYQLSTYITSADGTASNAVKVNNVKYVAASSGDVGNGDVRALSAIPNYLSTLNIRFKNDTPVRCQNAQLRLFDRISTDNAPSGVVGKVAVNVHPWNTQSPAGSGSTSWSTPGGSGTIVNMGDYPSAISPGASGLSPSGSATLDSQHDWYINLSVLPLNIGSQLFGLSFSTEFL